MNSSVVDRWDVIPLTERDHQLLCATLEDLLREQLEAGPADGDVAEMMDDHQATTVKLVLSTLARFEPGTPAQSISGFTEQVVVHELVDTAIVLAGLDSASSYSVSVDPTRYAHLVERYGVGLPGLLAAFTGQVPRVLTGAVVREPEFASAPVIPGPPSVLLMIQNITD